MTDTFDRNSDPPLRIAIPAALQHIALSAVTLIFARIVANAAGADEAQVTQYLALTMVAMGVGTLLQAWGRFGIGSGYLLLSHPTILYVPIAIEAVKLGGLGAVAGMMIVAGLTEMLLSRMLQRIKRFVPTEIIGLVILLLGIALGMEGVRLLLGDGGVSTPGTWAWLPGVGALITIVGVSVWGNAAWRRIPVLTGVAVGFLLGLTLHLSLGESAMHMPVPRWVTVSWPTVRPSFHAVLIPGVIVAALSCFVRGLADLTAAEQLDTPNWKRNNFRVMAAGTLADGLATTLAGVLGVIGMNTYSGSVGLCSASGVRSRRVGILAGLGWIVLSIVPGAAGLVAAIPIEVLGAACLFSATFTIRIGAAMIAQRLLDAKRTFAVGCALVLGLLYGATTAQGSILGRLIGSHASPLMVGMMAALVLNFGLRWGGSRAASIRWNPTEGARPLQEFMDRAGRTWGARLELMTRAGRFLEEFSTAAPALVHSGPVSIVARFDEVSLRIKLDWQGEPPATRVVDPDDPTLHSLAMLLMRHWSDRFNSSTRDTGQQTLDVMFDDS